MERPARKEARAKGIAIGNKKGIQLGREWAIRKAEAEAKGLPFNEPRPGYAPQLLREADQAPTLSALPTAATRSTGQQQGHSIRPWSL